MTELEIWNHWLKRLPTYFEKYSSVELGFLKETLEIEPDGYGGTDRLYYFEKESGAYYTQISHWDGGNMFANRSGSRTTLTKEMLAQVMTERKNHIESTLSPDEKNEFEDIFQEMLTFLLRQFAA